MGKVFSEMGVSLDGFIAGPNGGPGNPLGDGGQRIHQWVYGLASWRERLGLAGGETNRDDELVKGSYARPGAYVMGRRMFDEGEAGWPDNPPFRVSVFVVTHKAREPWIKEGGTTFHLVTDGIESALEQAKAAAGAKDVRIAGGADIVQQFINVGLIDELSIHLAPVLLSSGVRMFDKVGPELVLQDVEVIESPLVTHLKYQVGK